MTILLVITYYYANGEIHWLSKCQDKYLNELHYVLCSHISFVSFDHQFVKTQEFLGAFVWYTYSESNIVINVR